MKTISWALGIVALAFSAYFYIDNRYALSQEVKKIEQRLDYKIVSDQLKSTQDRIWRLEDRAAKEKVMSKTTAEEKRQLEADKKILEKKLEALEKK